MLLILTHVDDGSTYAFSEGVGLPASVYVARAVAEKSEATLHLRSVDLDFLDFVEKLCTRQVLRGSLHLY